MDGLLTRQATPDDAEDILNVILISMNQYAKESKIPSVLKSLQETKDDILTYIEKDYFLVCEYHSNIVACIRVSKIKNNYSQISRFCVLPTMQKLGVGKLIFSKAEKYIESKKFKYCILYTALTNLSTVNFYSSKGFELIETSYERGYPRGKFKKSY